MIANLGARPKATPPRQLAIDAAELAKDRVPAVPLDGAATSGRADGGQIAGEQGLDSFGERRGLRSCRQLADLVVDR